MLYYEGITALELGRILLKARTGVDETSGGRKFKIN